MSPRISAAQFLRSFFSPPWGNSIAQWQRAQAWDMNGREAISFKVCYHSWGFSPCLFSIGFPRFLFCLCHKMLNTEIDILCIFRGKLHLFLTKCQGLSITTPFRKSFKKHLPNSPAHFSSWVDLGTMVLGEKGRVRHSNSTPQAGTSPSWQGPLSMSPPRQSYS